MRKRGITIEQAKEIRAAKGIVDTRLQTMRVNRGMTQPELAKASGVTIGMIRQYERRSRKIDGAALDTLCDLCMALDCKIEDILESDRLVKKYKKIRG